MQFLVGREESKVAIICKERRSCGACYAAAGRQSQLAALCGAPRSLSFSPSKGPLLRVKPLQHARVHARAPATIYIRSWPDKKGRRGFAHVLLYVGQTSR